jgi:hypothetical protein
MKPMQAKAFDGYALQSPGNVSMCVRYHRPLIFLIYNAALHCECTST